MVWQHGHGSPAVAAPSSSRADVAQPVASTSKARAPDEQSPQNAPRLYEIAKGSRYDSLDELKRALHAGTMYDGVKYGIVRAKTGRSVEFHCIWHSPDLNASDRQSCPARLVCEHQSDGDDSPVDITLSDMAANRHDHPISDESRMQRMRRLCQKALDRLQPPPKRRRLTHPESESSPPSSRGWERPRVLRHRVVGGSDRETKKEVELAQDETEADQESSFESESDGDNVGGDEMISKESLLVAFPQYNTLEKEIKTWLSVSDSLDRPDSRHLVFVSSTDLTAYLYAWSFQQRFILYLAGGYNHSSTRACLSCLASSNVYKVRLGVKACECKIAIERRHDGTWRVASAVWTHSHACDEATMLKQLKSFESAQGMMSLMRGRGKERKGESGPHEEIQTLETEPVASTSKSRAASTVVTTSRASFTRSPDTISSFTHSTRDSLSAQSPDVKPFVSTSSHVVGESAVSRPLTEWVRQLDGLLGRHLRAPSSRVATLATLLVKHGVDSVEAFVDLALLATPARDSFLKALASKNVTFTLIDRQLLIGALSSFSAQSRS
ncbi:hypothetical protein ACM66B_005284 [Microbotryomycetes sp. NB124-2]